MVKLNDTLRVTIPSFLSLGKPDDTAKVIDQLQGYTRAVFDNVSVDWIDGGPDRGSCTNRKICSNFYFQSVQSGQSDLAFPPSYLSFFDHVPVNLSLSPATIGERCQFMNFYTDKSIKSSEAGILSSFAIFDFKVYFLIVFLWAMLLIVKPIRVRGKRRTHEASFRNDRQWLGRVLDGKVGSLVSIICHYSLYLVFLLLSASFQTDYSIVKFVPPMNQLEDMTQSQTEVASYQQLHCYRSSPIKLRSKNSFDQSSRLLYPIDVATVGIDDYIGSRLDKGRIVMFESTVRLPTSIRLFCNLMINNRGSTKFHIHIGTENYYGTFRLIAYNNQLNSVKKRYISTLAYACIENGYCIDALDKAARSTFRKFAQNENTEKAQCNDQSKTNLGQFYAHHSLQFTNIIDVLTLFLLLIGLSFSFFIVSLRGYKL